MAQIIKHRRGSLESLSAVTSSLQKGEIVIASGSTNLTVTNGSSIVFAVPENGQVQATNRFLIGDAAPNTFAAGTYNGMMKGVPYYASGSSTLYLLGSGGNDIINLEGNISNFSSSVATSINALSASIGGGSIGTSVDALNTFSGSTLVSLSALNSFSSSQLTQNSDLATYTSSVETRLAEVGVVSGSLFASASTAKTTNDTQDGRLTNLESTSASVNISVDALNTISASHQISIDALNAYTSSNTSTNALNAFTASAEERFTEIGVVSGSLLTSASNHEQRLDAIEAVSGAFARTDSDNNFNGTQTITGSLYITQDLVVYGSSSLFNVTASALDIGQNTIILNTATPAVRFGGISVADSGSGAGNSGSLFWDSVNNHWLYEQPSSSGAPYNSAMLISGPKNAGVLGEEVGLTNGKIPVAVGDDHIGDSIITQNGSASISIGGDVIVTGSLTVGTSEVALLGGDNLVTSSAQILFTEVDGYTTYSGSVSASLASIIANVGAGVGVSIENLNSFSSSQLTQNSDLATYTASVETRLTEIGVISGSLITSASVANVSIIKLNTFSASVETSISALNSSSASQQTQLDSLSDKTGSYATTGSNVFVGTQTISGSFNVSGSTNFNGAVAVDDSNMNLTNSSSLNLTNGSSIYVNGAGTISGSISGIGNVTAFSTSVDSRIDSLESAVGAGSNISVRLDNLESTSASVNVSVSNLNSKSASVDTSISNLNDFTASFGTTFSSSVDSRLDTLEGTGTIQGVGTTNDVTFNSVTTTGDVTIGGDLVVQGNTVTLNTATLIVEDKLITLASGSTSNATADGAGFEVAGTTASFKYDGTNNQFSSSVSVVANVTGSINLGSAAGSSKRVAFRNSNGNLDLVPTASVAGDLLQWDGTDFVMSNVIDGGSF